MLKLEDFIKYTYCYVITDTKYTNPSEFNREVAKYIETPTFLTGQQFGIIVALFEPYRKIIEDQIARGVDLSKVSVFIQPDIGTKIQSLICSGFHLYNTD